jgi:hypothetical protein
MKLSEQLKQDHECGDFGKALAGYAERAALLEDAVVSMVEDGWIHHGQEGMSEAQGKCYAAYIAIKTPNRLGKPTARRRIRNTTTGPSVGLTNGFGGNVTTEKENDDH